MQVLVLSGNNTQHKSYIEEFISSKNVTPYLITRFDEGFKIIDARSLHKLFSTKLQNHEVRLVVISSPTLDSQNALLKTLEELPQNTYVIFLVSSKEDLLSTILSRALYVDLGTSLVEPDEKLTAAFQKPYDIKNIFNFLSITPTDNEIETLIISLRVALFQNLEDTNYSKKLLHILKTLQKNYSFSKTNNINKKMVIEAALLQ